MAFDQGPITYRICTLADELPEDLLQRFAAQAAPPLEQVRDEPVWGWVSGRNLLENRIDEETSKLGSYIHICLRQAERKIPAALLNAECRMAELSKTIENGGKRPDKKTRKAIKDDIREKLLPNMPPQLSGIYAVIDKLDHKVYVSATSQRQLDLFADFFKKATEVDVIPMTPDSLAMELDVADPADIPCVNISPDKPDGSMNGTLGENFLTWLWFFQEERGGTLPPSKLGEFGLMIDGPLLMVAEGGGALESTIRKGTPTISAEAKAALMVGKKLRRAKLILARDKGEEWSVTVDAHEFVFRGLKVPEGDVNLDQGSIFDERVMNIYIFNTVFRALYQLFLKEMSDNVKVSEYQAKAKEWVKNRRGE